MTTPAPKTEFCLDALMLDLRHYVKEELQNCGKTHIDAETYPYHENETCYTRSDRERIRQIFIHLLDNAVRNIERGFIVFGYFAAKKNVVDFYVDDTRLNRNYNDDANEELPAARALLEPMGSRLKISRDRKKPSSLYFAVRGATKLVATQPS